MSRPVGVTASAIVAILGSMIALLFAVLLIITPSITIGQPPPPYAAQIGIVAGAIAAALAGLGIWTAVDLFRLRSWARTSILIFAGFLGAWAALALIVTMVMPLPSEVAAGTGQIFRTSMAVGFGTPLAIAVWWLIQFNSKSTKAAFASPVPEAASPRPLSISIIGGAGVVGGVGCLLWIPIRLPAFLFGVTFNGWTAGVIYGLFGALSVYIGKGLLDLRERARLLAIGWLVFGLVHTCVVTLVPSVRQRMFEAQRTISQNQQYPAPFDHGVMMYLTLVFAMILTAAPIYFLIRNRAAFTQADS